MMITGLLIRLIKMFIVWTLMGVGLMTFIIYFCYPEVNINSIKPGQVIEKVKPVIAKVKEELKLTKILPKAQKKISEIKNKMLEVNKVEGAVGKQEKEVTKQESVLDMNRSNFKDREKKLFARQLAIVSELTG